MSSAFHLSRKFPAAQIYLLEQKALGREVGCNLNVFNYLSVGKLSALPHWKAEELRSSTGSGCPGHPRVTPAGQVTGRVLRVAGHPSRQTRAGTVRTSEFCSYPRVSAGTPICNGMQFLSMNDIF